MDEIISQISSALVSAEAMKVKSLCERALAKNIPAHRVIEEGLVAGMRVVSQKLKSGEIFIPDVLMVSRAMHAGLYVLKPVLLAQKNHNVITHRVIIGTVAGDLHDIGKKLVSMMLETKGFEVIDLGIDIPPEEFAAAVIRHRPHIVAISALLTTTLVNMKKTIDYLQQHGLRDQVLIMVGGGPVTQDLAFQMGADGYGYDAASAAENAESLVNRHGSVSHGFGLQ